MRETLAESLEIVLPHLSREIAAPEILPRLRHLARTLPPNLPCGLEFRLTQNVPQVDLLQCILREDHAPSILREYIESTDLIAEPAWQRVRDFCAAWSDAAFSLYSGIGKIWLEFDLDSDSARPPVPSVFIALDAKLPTFPDGFRVAQAAVALLVGAPLPSPLLANLERCFRACRDRAFLSHIGVMLARSLDMLRVNIPRLERTQVADFLGEVGWIADGGEFERLLDWVYVPANPVTVCLDVGATVSPRIGLELGVDERLPDAEQTLRWSLLLDDLVARGLCAPEKRHGLLGWPGLSFPSSTTHAWPDHLISRSFLEPPERFSVMGRRLSHIKLVYQPGQPPEAKGYLGFGHLWVKPESTESDYDPVGALQVAAQPGDFALADRARMFKFPDDHGPHPEYQTEWWYYSGNLTSDEGRRFGYQLTFFRRALTPETSARGSDAPARQLYFAHFAVADIQNNRHVKTERYSRRALPNAGAAGHPYRVWVDDWTVDALNGDGSAVRLRASDPSPVPADSLNAMPGRVMSLDLTLTSTKPPVLHGEAGLSQKTAATGNASYYVSLTHLLTEGTLYLEGELYPVKGRSWMDHEFGTTQLGPEVQGWDWFSIQLDDQREVMFYHIRNKDGSVEPHSSGTIVEPDGSTIPLTLEQVELDVLDHWKSETYQRIYPARWRIKIPSAGLDLSLVPYIADQEMPSKKATYWEGAVAIEGTSYGGRIQGSGYVEMTGY